MRDTQVQATSATYTFSTIAAYLAAANGSTPKGYSNFTQTYGNPSIVYNSLFTNFFAQDAWKPRRNLTVTYGLRYDLYQMPAADPNSTFSFSQKFRPDKNNFGPRLGFAWGVGSDQKTVIRAGYGIAFDTVSSFQVTAVSGKVPGLTTTCSSTVGGATTPGCAAAPDKRIGEVWGIVRPTPADRAKLIAQYRRMLTAPYSPKGDVNLGRSALTEQANHNQPVGQGA